MPGCTGGFIIAMLGGELWVGIGVVAVVTAGPVVALPEGAAGAAAGAAVTAGAAPGAAPGAVAAAVEAGPGTSVSELLRDALKSLGRG